MGGDAETQCRSRLQAPAALTPKLVFGPLHGEEQNEVNSLPLRTPELTVQGN